MKLPAFNKANGVYIQLDPDIKHFEEQYISLRRREDRIYTDDEVKKLPAMIPAHPHYKEWRIRNKTSRKLYRYLAAKKQSPQILEVGCGNGWLTSKLAGIPGSWVTGTDINLTELQQAERVFSNVPNLEFLFGDIRSGILNNKRFDMIVFAASIQYFPSLSKVLNAALHHLQPKGEIHILDTRFYELWELQAARQRTTSYYESIGHPGMSDHYFHHCIQEFQPFSHALLYNPFSYRNLLFRNKNPFHWICVKHG